MPIIDTQDKQGEIEITERKTVFESGREIHTVTLNVSGVSVSVRIHKHFGENQPSINIFNVETICPTLGVTVFHENKTKMLKKLRKLPDCESNSTRLIPKIARVDES